METSKYEIPNIRIGGENEKYYIHFNTKNECDLFLSKYPGRKGMSCCFGKGCHLPGVSSWKEIHSLKKNFIQ